MNESEETSLVPVQPDGPPPVAVLPMKDEVAMMLTLAGNITKARGHAIPASIDSPEKAFAVILAGWELGVRPMTALRHVFVVNGRTEPDAQLMMGLVRARDETAEFIFHRTDGTECEVELRRGGRSVVRLAYTAAMAKASGQITKGAWTSYPADMLRWAAVKRACRLGAPDLVNSIPSVGLDDAAATYEETEPIIEGQLLEGEPPAPELDADGVPIGFEGYKGPPPEAREEEAAGPWATYPPTPPMKDLGTFYRAAQALGCKSKSEVWRLIDTNDDALAATDPELYPELYEQLRQAKANAAQEAQA